MIDGQSYLIGVSAAQAAMSPFIAGLRVDGKWGGYTQSAYVSLEPAQRKRVDDAIAVAVPNTSAVELATYRATQKISAASAAPEAKGDMVALITRIANREGVPPRTAIAIARLESRLNPDAYNKSGATGLFQIMPIALAETNKVYGVRNLRTYTMADMRDAEMNAIVGVQYIKIAARQIGVTLDQAADIYMCYNIGIGNLRKLQARAFTDPALVKAVRNQAYGGNVTTYAANVTKAIAEAMA